MHEAPDTGIISVVQQVARPLDTGGEQRIPMPASLVGIAKIGGRVKHGIDARQRLRKAGHIAHIALHDIDIEIFELQLCLVRRAYQRPYPPSGRYQFAHEIVAEKPCRPRHESEARVRPGVRIVRHDLSSTDEGACSIRLDYGPWSRMVSMFIGEFARRTGLSQDTVRFYVRKRLLAPETGAQGGRNPYQIFTERDVSAPLMIRFAQSLGMPLKEIGEIARELANNGLSAEREIEIEIIDTQVEGLERKGNGPCQTTRLSARQTRLDGARQA